MSLIYRISSCALLAMMHIASSPAENLNVSRIAIAPRNIDWAEEATAPIVQGSWAIFDYWQSGHARIQGDLLDFYVKQWSQVNWADAPALPNITRLLATPAPTSSLKYGSPYYQLAKVDMAPNPRVVQSRTFGTGWAQSAANYTIKVFHGSAQPLDYFIYLYHPKILTGVQAAYTLQPGGPGGSGGTYLYKHPDSAGSRAAVDVLVDGLPVWSTESAYMYPEDTADYAWDKLFTKWGSPVVDNGTTKLYIGRLAAYQVVHVSLIVRTDVKAVASQCGTEYASYGSADTKRCFDLTQTVQLQPGAQIPAIYVFGKYLNTTPVRSLSSPF
jgi:hypothetical protein